MLIKLNAHNLIFVLNIVYIFVPIYSNSFLKLLMHLGFQIEKDCTNHTDQKEKGLYYNVGFLRNKDIK